MRLPDITPFRHPPFAWFWGMRACLVLGYQVQATALGWQVYDRAREAGQSVEEAAFLLGVVGLVQFLPLMALSLFGGQAADRFNRRWILAGCVALKFTAALALLGAARLPAEAAIAAILSVAAALGAVNAFQPAAAQSLMPTLVPRSALPQAIALNSLAFTSMSIIGPALSGLLYAGGGPGLAYGSAAALLAAAGFALSRIKAPPQAKIEGAQALKMIGDGLSYVRDNPIVLGAISLDLVVVFLAGAQALLPVFARDILHAGPEGLGILRAAPAAGAALVGLTLAAAPLRSQVGRWMFVAVGGFGLATIVFGLSQAFWLTAAALALAGACDMVSVYVRQSLIQLATPDHMRGRVTSVSFIFISASNELGDFEAGVMARILGPAIAVATGGTASLAAAFAWTRLFPQLWAVDAFEDAARYASTASNVREITP